MQNASKGEILQVMTDNVCINAVTLQKLQHMIVSAVDQLEVVRNS